MNWHQLEINEVFTRTASSPNGLTAAEASEVRQKTGRNELTGKKAKPAWRFFVDQFRDFMILVLIAAAVISGVIGDLTDTIIILIIVLLNAVVGFIQEYRAEQALEALKKIATPNATVRRGGLTVVIPAE